MDHQLSWFDANAGWIGFAGLVVGVLGVLTGFIFYWLSRRPKRFGWQLMDQTPILTADSKGLPLKIIYAGEHEVSKPNLVVVRLGNRGKVEIRSDDYDGPVKVSFIKSHLIGSVLIDGLNLDLKTELSQGGNTVEFTPPLLNKGEWMELQLVTDGPLEVPVVKARVAGQSGEITELARARRRFVRRIFLASLVLFFGLVITVIILAVTEVPIYSFLLNAIPVLFVVVIGCCVVSLQFQDISPTWSMQPRVEKSPRVGNVIMRAYQGARKWVE